MPRKGAERQMRKEICWTGKKGGMLQSHRLLKPTPSIQASTTGLKWLTQKAKADLSLLISSFLLALC